FNRMAHKGIVAILGMRSSNGGCHDLAAWGFPWGCFRGLSEAGDRVRADDSTDSLPDAGSSLAAADLRLAKLRPVSEIPGAAGFPQLLAEEARWAAALGHRGALPADQADRIARRRRGVSAALKLGLAKRRKGAGALPSDADHLRKMVGSLRVVHPVTAYFVLASASQRSGRQQWPRKSRQHDRLPARPSRRNGPAGTAPPNQRPARQSSPKREACR